MVFLVSEDLIEARTVFEIAAVRDDLRWMNLAAFNAIQQWTHVAHHVRLSHTEGKPFVHRLTEWDLIDEPAIDAGHRHRAALPARLDCLAQHVGTVRGHATVEFYSVVNGTNRVSVGFQTDGVDAGIRAASGRELLERFDDVVHIIEV